jgi:hypothetical protein
MTAITGTSGGYIVTLCVFYFYKLIGKLTAFFAASGVELTEHDRDHFHSVRSPPS